MKKNNSFPKNVTPREAIENLANAIVKQAVADYESLISEAPLAEMFPSSETTQRIRLFAKEQEYTGVDVVAVLDKIDSVYVNLFKPYVREHGNEIIHDWKEIHKGKNKYAEEQKLENYPHKCPLCGGNLRPMVQTGRSSFRKTHTRYISCTDCNLNAKVYNIKEVN